MAAAPSAQAPANELLEPLTRAYHLLRVGWTHATVLADEEIARRVRVLDLVLWLALSDAQLLRREPLNPWSLSFGFHDVRQALAAFQRRVPPPPAILPGSDELVAIWSSAPGQGAGMSALHRDITNRLEAKAERVTPDA